MASFRKRNNGWQYRISYKDAAGTYREKTKSGFKTKSEAKVHADKAEKLLNKQIATKSLGNASHSFLDYFLIWYQIYKEPHISEITKLSYKATMSTIKKHFPGGPIVSLSSDNYQNFLNYLGTINAKSTISKRHKHIKACVHHGLHTGIIATDFTYNAKLSGAPGKKASLKYIDRGDAQLLMKSLLDGYDGSQTGRAMCVFALSTGCRIGEVMALTQDCISRTQKTVDIQNSWDYKITKNFIKTKTASSVRTIAIDDITLTVLDQHIRYYKKLALKTGARNNKNLVFVGTGMAPISTTGANKSLKKACLRADITPITFHSLRHTHASLLLLGGSDIFFVSKRLGHHTSTVTADVYAHVLKEMEDKGNKQVDALAKALFK